MASLRCVYTDLDGTLLGKEGSLLRDSQGEFSLSAIKALEVCWRADVEVVIFSGRRKITVQTDARLLGQSSYIYEAGCGVVVDGEEELLTDDLRPTEDGVTVYDQISRSGATELLLNNFNRRLEYHTPWHLERDFSHIFRGNVDVNEANNLLHQHGHGQLRLLDNGAIHRRSATLDVEKAYVYHLLPKAASKARAVARHMRIRGYTPEECIAIGDSREDLGASAVVGQFWLVANALKRDPRLQEIVNQGENIKIASEENGAGVYEAVVTSLSVLK